MMASYAGVQSKCTIQHGAVGRCVVVALVSLVSLVLLVLLVASVA